MNDGTKLAGYVRCSTVEQAVKGHGLNAQEAAIRTACAGRGWQIQGIYSDEGASGSTLDREQLMVALEAIQAGHATGLIVSKLDRLSRSVADCAALLSWFTESEAVLVALDVGVDTSTPGGRLVANVIASVGQWERETIAARTKDGLAAARAAGGPISRPSVADDPKLQARIRRMRSRGLTLQEIADRLNATGVPTLRGGSLWRPSSVQSATGYKRRKPRPGSTDLPDLSRRKNRRTAV